MIKISWKTAAMALAIPGLALATPSQASAPAHAAPVAHQAAWAETTYEHGRDRYRDRRGRYDRHDRYDRRSRYDRYDRYDRRDRGYRGEPIYRDTRIWRGRDGRYYCRRKDGTTGLIIGAAVGGLIGNEVAGRRGDRTLGAILGAAGGAILGRSIDRSGSRCR